MPSPTVKLMPSSSVATTGGITQATQDTTTPNSAGVEMKASFYFLTFLLLMFKIMG